MGILLAVLFICEFVNVENCLVIIESKELSGMLKIIKNSEKNNYNLQLIMHEKMNIMH